MSVDDGLGRSAIFVKTGGCHGLLDLTDGLLGGGDACLELFDATLSRLFRALAFPGFRVGPLSFLTRWLRFWGRACRLL